MSGGPSLRRVAAADLEAVESDPALSERIRAEIDRSGPITFARFMELALYDPDRGYYRSPAARPGTGGDFITSPEAHPIFGRAIARFAEGVWSALGRPERFTIREFGAGGGALALPLLERLAKDGSLPAAGTRYRAVEVEPRRTDELRARLAAAGLAERIEDDDGAPIVGLAIANEVLDALPTHRVVQRGGSLRELRVTWADGAFVDIERDSETPGIAARLEAEGITLADGQRAEVCLELDRWIATAADGLERGVLLVLDYGHPAGTLYDPRLRPEGTVAAYYRQQVHHDPYVAVGRQDLTAHVDLTAVGVAAERAGLAHLATMTQSAFLAALGIGDLLVELQTGPDASLERYLEARSALVRMIDPAAMGGFRVLAFGRGIDEATALRGLT